MWKYIKIKNKDYAISTRKENNVWKISLTDFVDIWNEELQTETIVKRCKELNPLLKIERLNIDQIMNEIFIDIPQYAVEKEPHFKITLSKNIQGGRFKFEIHLNKGNNEEFFEVITKLISLLSLELFRRYSVLLKIIKQKDDEIAEYKAEGAQLIRKNIETKPFTEDLLRLEQSNTGISSVSTFQSLVDLCNEAEELNLKKNSICLENSKRPNESVKVTVEAGENSNDVAQSSEIAIASSELKLPIENKSREHLKHKQEEKRLKTKRVKGSISASFTKPIKKAKSRVTNFIS